MRLSKFHFCFFTFDVSFLIFYLYVFTILPDIKSGSLVNFPRAIHDERSSKCICLQRDQRGTHLLIVDSAVLESLYKVLADGVSVDRYPVWRRVVLRAVI